MAEHGKGKKALKDFIAGSEGDPTSFFNQMRGDFNMPEPAPPTVELVPTQMVMPIPRKFNDERSMFKRDLAEEAEEQRFNRMVELNGKTFDNGERSQGDQEAEQRMVQNKKTGLLQKFVNMITKPFNDAFEKEFGTEDQPKFGGKDAVMYNGKFIHPDLYKMLMNRPDLKQRFDETGSIYGN